MLFLILFLSYFIGSIPFGFLLTKIFLKKDIREIGSGNIGATNALRTGNKLIGYSTLALDICKAVILLLIIKSNFSEYLFTSSIAVFLGHVFPIWLKFKGGKGVASFIGYILFISWPLTILFIVIWTITVKAFKISSIGAIIGLLANIIFFKLLLFIQFKYGLFLNIPGQPLEFNFILLISFLIFFKHKGNVKNILK